MKRLNPIYILALVITLFMISVIFFNDKKGEFKLLNSEYNSFKIKIEDFKEYKQTWYDEKNVLKKIDSILKNSIFKNEKILRTQNSDLIKVKIESKNPKVLSRFINKFLNERFIIKRLNVQKTSITIEIGLRK